MKIDFLNPFVSAALQVISAEINAHTTKGVLSAQEGDYLTNDVTIYIGVTGAVDGQVFYGMSKETVLNIASHMLQQDCTEMTKMVYSCISELANMVNGKASMNLESAGYACRVSPPTILAQKDTLISTLTIKRITVPVVTPLGEISLCLGLRTSVKI